MYRQQWENDPEFEGWLSQDPDDLNKAYCNYCQISLSCLNKSDIRKHAGTEKHRRNARIRNLEQVAEQELHQTDSDTGSSQESIPAASVQQEEPESRREESSEASTLANLSSILERMGNLLIDVQSSITVLGNEVQRCQQRVMELSERQSTTDEKIDEVLKLNRNILEKISKE